MAVVGVMTCQLMTVHVDLYSFDCTVTCVAARMGFRVGNGL